MSMPDKQKPDTTTTETVDVTEQKVDDVKVDGGAAEAKADEATTTDDAAKASADDVFGTLDRAFAEDAADTNWLDLAKTTTADDLVDMDPRARAIIRAIWVARKDDAAKAAADLDAKQKALEAREAQAAERDAAVRRREAAYAKLAADPKLRERLTAQAQGKPEKVDPADPESVKKYLDGLAAEQSLAAFAPVHEAAAQQAQLAARDEILSKYKIDHGTDDFKAVQARMLSLYGDVDGIKAAAQGAKPGNSPLEVACRIVVAEKAATARREAEVDAVADRQRAAGRVYMGPGAEAPKLSDAEYLDNYWKTRNPDMDAAQYALDYDRDPRLKRAAEAVQ